MEIITPLILLKKHLRQIAYFIICLLVLNTGLSAAASASSNGALSNSGEKILLCTTQGYQWVYLDEISSDNPPQNTHSIHCPLCLAASPALDHTLVFLLVDILLEPDTAIHFDDSKNEGLINTFLAYSPAPPRAPPLS